MRKTLKFPDGYCLDPNGKMSVPFGKQEDYDFGYEVGFDDAWRIRADAIATQMGWTPPSMMNIPLDAAVRFQSPMDGRWITVPTPESAQEPDPLEQFAKPERSAADDYVPRVSLGERAQESAGVLTDGELIAISNALQATGYAYVADKLRAILSANKEQQP